MSKQSRRPNGAGRHNTIPITAAQRWRGSRGSYWLIALAAAVALVGATFLVGSKSNANAAGPIKIGEVAPTVVGRDVVSGRMINSKNLSGQNVLYYLNEGVMCQACLVQIQALQQHVAHLTGRHLTLVSVTNDDASTLRVAAADFKITTPLIADTNREISKSFGVLGGIPAGVGMHSDTANHTFILVDQSGKVRFVKDYPNMWVDVNELLKQLPRLDGQQKGTP